MECRQNPQDVKQTSTDDALSAITEIIERGDISATQKYHAMMALFKKESPALSLEQLAKKLAWDVWQKTDGRCAYCNAKLNPFDRNAWNGYHMDHVEPRSRGGADTIDNLAPACSRCNFSKYAHTPEEWGGRAQTAGVTCGG